MAGEVSAQQGALQRGAQLIDEARRDLDKQCNDLRHAIEGIRDSWTGAGAGAFRQVLEHWDVAARSAINELDKLESNLVRAEAGYRNVDEAQAARMTRLQGRLG